MAVKDVRRYYYKMRDQYLEMKADLADFEQAVADGNITEDQLAAAKEQVNEVEVNYNRLMYIMYLLEMPNRNSKKGKYNKANKKVLKELINREADEDTVWTDNKSALDDLRAELKKLTSK